MAAAGARADARTELRQAVYHVEGGKDVAEGIDTGDATKDQARKAVAQRSDELKAYRDQPGVTAEALIDKAVELKNEGEVKTPFDAKAQKATREQFGSGRAKDRDAVTGKATKDGAGVTKIDDRGDLQTGEADSIRETIDRAETAMDRADTFLRYSAVLLLRQAEERKPDATPATIQAVFDKALQEYGFANAEEFNTAEEESLDVLRNDRAIRAILEEDFADLDPDPAEQAKLERQLVKDLFVRDPKLREKVNDRMQGIAKKAKNELPAVVEDKWPATEKRRSDAETEVNSQMTNIKNHMNSALGFSVDFKQSIEDGATADALIAEYKDAALEGVGITPEQAGFLSAYSEKEKAIAELTAKKGQPGADVAEIDKQIAQLEKEKEEQKKAFRKQALKEKGLTEDQATAIVELREAEDALQKQRDEKEATRLAAADPSAVDLRSYDREIARLQELIDTGDVKALMDKAAFADTGAVDAAKDVYRDSEGTFTQAKTDYDLVQTLVTNTGDTEQDADGNPRPTIRKIFTDAVKAQEARKKAEEELAGIGSKEDSAATAYDSRITRRAAERKLVESMENVFSDSFADVMKGRIGELRALQQKEADQKAAEAKKRGEDEVAKNIRDLQERMNKKWVDFDPDRGLKEAHHEVIMSEIRYLMARGDTPEHLNEAVTRLMMVDLGLTPNDGGTPPRPKDWKTVSLDELDPTDRANLEATRAQMQDAYLNQMLTSFISERGLRDKLGGWGSDMGLTNDEWARLDKVLGTHLQTGIKKSKEMSDAVKKLESQGVRMDIKKYLWIFLAALAGGALSVGALPVAGGAVLLGGGLPALGIGRTS